MTCGASGVNYWMRVGTRDNDVRTKREDEGRLSDSKAAIARHRLAEPVSPSPLLHSYAYPPLYVYASSPRARTMYPTCPQCSRSPAAHTAARRARACARASEPERAARGARRAWLRSNRISNGRRATCIVSPERRQRLTSPDDISFAL